MRIEVAGIPIIYAAEHRVTATAIAEAIEKTVSVVSDHWKLSVPKGCEVHVLTDWEEFINQTVPRHLRLLVNLTKPLWRKRAERAFMLAGGWLLPWRGRPSVGVKPPELLIRSKSELGKRLFVAVSDPLEKIRHLACHEFTHACTAHLRLPPWLNEGIAMRTVDHMVEYTTVLEETQNTVQFDLSVLNRKSYRRIKSSDYDSLIQLYATGYWVIRKLEKENPSIIDELLKRRCSFKESTRIIEQALNPSYVGENA
jgi:hypothetical protein